MGIKGLQRYTEVHCPQACRRVQLRLLARSYFQKYNQPPTLVVDGMCCLTKLYAPGMDWVHGGQWFQYYLEVKKFVKAFQDAGIQLVFIFDGSVTLTKRSVWTKRAKGFRKDVNKVFDIIKNTGRQPGFQHFIWPVSLGIFTRFILKELGVTVINSSGEADEEIFDYCQRHQCFGILSQDSDFMAYNTHSDYFSVADLNLNKMTTTRYDRVRLCQHLNLNLNQLPILATLMGNDVIPHPKLLSFHCTLLGVTRRDRADVTLDRLMPKLASYISEKCRSIGYCSAVKEMSMNILMNTKDQIDFIHSVLTYMSKRDPLREGLSEVLSRVQSRSVGEGSSRNSASPGLRDTKSHHTASNNPWSLAAGAGESKLTFAEIVSKPATVTNNSTVVMASTDDDNSSTTSSGISSNNPEDKEKSGVPPSKPDMTARVLQLAKDRHGQCENLPLIYNVLSGVELDTGVALEDDSNTDIPSAVVIYTAIKQKLFGLLLGVGVVKDQIDHQGADGVHLRQGSSWTALPDDPCAMIPSSFPQPPPQPQLQYSPMSVGIHSLPEDPCAIVVGMSQVRLGLGNSLPPPLGPHSTALDNNALGPWRNAQFATSPTSPFSAGATQQPPFSVNEPKILSSIQSYAGAANSGVILSTTASTTVSTTTTENPTAGQPKDLVVGKNAILEWAVYTGCTLTEPDVVPAVPLQISGGTPSLDRLWFDKDPATLQVQWESLRDIMCCRIPLHDLRRLESKYVLLCCVLHFLLAQEAGTLLLYEKELDAFIAQAISPMAGDTSRLKSLKVPTVDPRAVQLAVLFMRGLTLGLTVLGACGYPLPLMAGMPWRCFDGKLFHLKYLQARDGADLASLCDYYGPAMETFDYLKSLIILSTRLDQ